MFIFSSTLLEVDRILPVFFLPLWVQGGKAELKFQLLANSRMVPLYSVCDSVFTIIRLERIHTPGVSSSPRNSVLLY